MLLIKNQVGGEIEEDFASLISLPFRIRVKISVESSYMVCVYCFKISPPFKI